MLAQHEITYLHLCHWFYPTYLKYNKRIKTLNLKIIYEGATYEIDSFGLFHSLIGDLAPLSKGRLAGGHCNYENMLSSISKVVIQEELPHGFQQARLYNLRKPYCFKNSTLFSSSLTHEQCIETVIETIQNSKKIIETKFSIKNPNILNIKYQIAEKSGIQICLDTKTKHTTFFPFKIESLPCKNHG